MAAEVGVMAGGGADTDPDSDSDCALTSPVAQAAKKRSAFSALSRERDDLRRKVPELEAKSDEQVATPLMNCRLDYVLPS